MRENHTAKSAEKYHNLMQLEKALPSIVTQAFWQKQVPMDEKILFLQALAHARTSFWETVYNDFPQVRGLSASATDTSIIYEYESPSLINEEKKV